MPVAQRFFGFQSWRQNKPVFRGLETKVRFPLVGSHLFWRLSDLWNILGSENSEFGELPRILRERPKNQIITEQEVSVKEEKTKITAYVQPDTAEMVEKLYKLDGCKSRSEFVDSALQFYIGFLNAKDYSAYIPNVVISTMKGALSSLEHRIAKLFFKNTVELAILQHAIAAIGNIDPGTLQEVRGMCIEDVKSVNGSLDFEDVVRFQKE